MLAENLQRHFSNASLAVQAKFFRDKTKLWINAKGSLF
ncbi:Hypothetical protein Minf_0910 [Methylacidiphilum infernorum V4]|uniref:Uncharacterized protein n=1 Tax=Methylacidiphilum infernorum (isolate V4) TaxID=481448 RepID=B3DUG2_METI4|nr:Hypothetical protein Minf_0910 [Methylacidiphilum infernorum V4]